MALLTELVNAALDGNHGGTVFVSGEAGIGKSRLCREVADLARRRGAPTIVGRAVEGGGTPPPLRPLVEAIASLTRERDLPSAEELGAYAAVLGRLVPEWASPLLHPEALLPTLLGEGLLRLQRLMAPDGCVVVIEDLHWSDPETLAVLEYLADHTSGHAMLLLCSMRDTPATAARALADALTTRASARLLSLSPLADAEVQEMVRACGVPDVAGLARAADGLPLLVEELLGERGSAVPASFADSVGRRVARLMPGEQRAVRAAAVLGRRFDWRLLAEGADIDDATLTTTLDRATANGLLRPADEGYQFRHALTRDAVLAATPAPELTALATGLGAALRRRQPSLPGSSAVLAADLADRAGDPAAAELFMLAGRRAARDGALDSAAALLQRGLAVARTTALRVEIADALADVRCRAGGLDAARTATHALVALLRESDDEELRRHAHLRLARCCAEAARWDDADTELASVAGPPGAPGIEETLVRALILLGRHDTERAAQLAGDLVAPSLEMGRPDLACEALELSGRAARGSNPEAALAAFERALALAVRHDLPLAQLSALHELGTIDMFSTGRRDRLLDARRGAEAAGLVRLTAVLDLQLVAAHHMHGDAAAGLEAAQRALEGATSLGIEPMRIIALALTACPTALSADREATEAAIAAIPAGALDADPDSQSSLWGTSRATCSLLREERATAVHELETAAALVEGATEIRPQTWWGFWVLLRALEGRDAEAAIARLRGCPAASNRQNLAYAELAEAALAGRRGHQERAAAIVESWDARRLPWAWLRHLGRRLVAEAALRDGWGEPRRWLAEAADFFGQFGAPAVEQACRNLLSETPSLPEALHRRGVTPREAEVFLLLGQGVTGTRELAQRLVISPRTVEKHVEALCRKLEVRARSQLAALAARETDTDGVRSRR